MNYPNIHSHLMTCPPEAAEIAYSKEVEQVCAVLREILSQGRKA